MSAGECPVCSALPGEPHKMSCRPQNRRDAEERRRYEMTTDTKSILLIYEEIPQRTVIALLNGADLAAAGLSASEVMSLCGTYDNTVDLAKEKEEIHAKVHTAVFGEYNEDTEEQGPALWADKIIFRTDDEALCREGMPPEITGDTVVVHTGFAL
jgi:hypothetical protein